MKKYILDNEGNPQPTDSIEEWGTFYENPARILARTTIGDSYVSTVFLGLDHSFTNEGPPILWETLVFGGPLEDSMERYATRQEALAGHEAMCNRVKEHKP